jgi:DNA-binding transcriptional MocR family regulator
LQTGLTLAFEARAIYRLEQEAGHLMSEEHLRSMKAEYNKRRAALAH